MLRLARAYLGTAIGLTLTALCGTGVLVAWLLARARGVDVVSRFWGRAVLFFGGVRVAVRGAEQLDPAQPYVFVTNHQSGLDIILLSGYLPHYAHFVAKQELRSVPFVGWALRLSNHVLIDRGDGAAAIASLKAAAVRVRAGNSVVIFPEGTRFPPRQLGPFKRGAFVLARAAQVPIVPVGIVGTAERMRARQIYTTPGLVGLRVGAPITPDQFDADDAVLAARVREIVAELAGPSAAHDLACATPPSLPRPAASQCPDDPRP